LYRAVANTPKFWKTSPIELPSWKSFGNRRLNVVATLWVTSKSAGSGAAGASIGLSVVELKPRLNVNWSWSESLSLESRYEYVASADQ
jgi:hypothetical protein